MRKSERKIGTIAGHDSLNSLLRDPSLGSMRQQILLLRSVDCQVTLVGRMAKGRMKAVSNLVSGLYRALFLRIFRFPSGNPALT